MAKDTVELLEQCLEDGIDWDPEDMALLLHGAINEIKRLRTRVSYLGWERQDLMAEIDDSSRKYLR